MLRGCPERQCSGQTPPPAAGDKAAAEPPDSPAGVVADTEERDVVVETESIRAVFSTRGAVLRSWTLKAFFDDHRRQIDLVPAIAPADAPRPFSIAVGDPALSARLDRALFRPNATRLDPQTGQRELTFDYEDASGLAVRKTFEFVPDGQAYVVAVTIDARQGSEALPVTLASGPGLGDTERAAGGGSFFSPNYYQAPEGIFNLDNKVTRVVASELATQPQRDGRFRYFGVDDQYFLGAILAGDRTAKVAYQPVTVQTPLGPRGLIWFATTFDQPWQRVKYYLGPKEFDTLAATDRELTRVINFGIFSWLVVPLLRSLNWINGFVGNYGWSIILLTILINAAMFPLRHKSVVSMRRLQELQPQIKAIQDRYANLKVTDPSKQQMNQEMMALYREKGVNPASGCIPMLLTFPVLLAFYSLLSQSIEIRGAGFMGWIHDLSTYDPYFVTPILMGATMVWQQRITPSTADPTQQKVMMFMPLLFTFMFVWAPSGLVIYWLVSNLWAIGQQDLTNYLIGPPSMKKAGAPVERRTKKADAAARGAARREAETR